MTLLGSVFSGGHMSRRSRTQISADASLRRSAMEIIGQHELSHRQVAEEAGLPYTTVAKWCSGEVLPSKWIPAMERWVEGRG